MFGEAYKWEKKELLRDVDRWGDYGRVRLHGGSVGYDPANEGRVRQSFMRKEKGGIRWRKSEKKNIQRIILMEVLAKEDHQEKLLSFPTKARGGIPIGKLNKGGIFSMERINNSRLCTEKVQLSQGKLNAASERFNTSG